MDDRLNVGLEDAELLDEVELTTNLMIAGSEAVEPLSQEQVDELLGVDPGAPRTIPQQLPRASH